MRVLDLFCGAGGAGMGYRLAWPDAEIVGVDINPQPRYPFTFVQGDAMTFDLSAFDFIHASPPCQSFTAYRRRGSGVGNGYPNLIPATRERLRAHGAPYVIENVPGAPLDNPVQLCGSSFGLDVRRHRLFECSFPTMSHPCNHGAQRPRFAMATNRTNLRRTVEVGVWRIPLETQQRAMGINWMELRELSQAIPPAYTRFLAEQFDAWRSTRPAAPAALEHTRRTTAHRCADASEPLRTFRTAESEGVPSGPINPVVGHVRIRLARGEHDLDLACADFGHIHDGLNGAEVRAENDVAHGEVEQGGGLVAHGSGSQQDGVDHKDIQPQTLWSVNHKLGGAP